MGERLRDGIVLDPEDAIIAGIAPASGKSIIAMDIRHFRGIKGLPVGEY